MRKRGVLLFLFAIVLAVAAVFYTSSGKVEGGLEVAQVTGCATANCVGSSTVTLSSSLNSALNNLYVASENEFVACLLGKKYGSEYNLVSYSLPSHVETKEGGAIYSSCSNDSLGVLHNHYNPSGDEYLCQLSARDIYTFGQDGSDLMGIICGKDKYVFLHKSDLKPAAVDLPS